jgi:hypothetical protein
MMSETVFLDAELTDAGRIGVHPQLLDLGHAVAPATASEFNRLRAPLVAVACWRMDDARFDFDSSFVRPTATKEIALLRQIVKAHPGSPLSIFGHTDPTGDDDYNKRLSGRRARAIYGLLIRDVDIWEELFTHPMSRDQWGTKPIQTMLQALRGRDGQPFHRDAIDGIEGPKTREALQRFQREQGLPATGASDSATRKKLFRVYMDFLCKAEDSEETLELKRTDFLARGTDRHGKGDHQGCGEFNPVLVFSRAEQREFQQPALKPQRDAENLPNRRVTIFLFEKGRQVDPQQWPCPRSTEGPAACRKRFFSDGEKRRSPQERRRLYQETQDTFACRFYDRLANSSPCEGAGKLAVFRLRLCDPLKDPIGKAPCRIIQGASHIPGQADDKGFITVIAKHTPSKVRIEWTTPDRAAEEVFPFSLEVFVAPPIEGEEGAFQRLHNVGYSQQATLEEKVRAFQRDFGRQPTGDFRDIEKELKDWHDGGNKPPVKV